MKSKEDRKKLNLLKNGYVYLGSFLVSVFAILGIANFNFTSYTRKGILIFGLIILMLAYTFNLLFPSNKINIIINIVINVVIFALIVF